MTEEGTHELALNRLWNAVIRGEDLFVAEELPREDIEVVARLQQASEGWRLGPRAEDVWPHVLARINARRVVEDTQMKRFVQAGDHQAPPVLPNGHAVGRYPPTPDVAVAHAPRPRVSASTATAALVLLTLVASVPAFFTWHPKSEEQLRALPALMATPPGEPAKAVDQAVAFDAEALRTHLGSGWVVSVERALVADPEAPTITGFLGSSTVHYRGPAGAQVSVLVFPLAADPAALATAWDWIGEAEFDIRAADALRHVPNAEQLAAQAPLPAGCREARRLEGTDQLVWDVPVGMTLCAVGTEEIILVLTSGEVLDREGVAASDRVAELVAADLIAAPIVATHHVSPEIPSVNLRAEPTRTAAIVTAVDSGTAVRWLGDAARAIDPTDGMSWLKVRTADGEEGWIRGIDLVPLPPTSNTTAALGTPAAIMAPATPGLGAATEDTLLDITIPAELLPRGDRAWVVFEQATSPAGSTGRWLAGNSAGGPGLRVHYVLDGSVVMRAESDTQLLRAGAGSMLEGVPAGTEVMLGPGDTWIIRNETGFDAVNPTEAPTELLVWVMTNPEDPVAFLNDPLPRNWFANSDVLAPPGGVEVPSGPATMRIRRVELPVKGSLPAPADGLQYGAAILSNAQSVGNLSNGRLVNIGRTSATVYVLNFASAEVGAGMAEGGTPTR